MNIQLEDNEITFILNVLGELPSKSGAFILLQKISLQQKAQEQAVKQEEVKG